MPAYVILYRPDSDLNVDHRTLLRDINGFTPVLRGACACETTQKGKLTTGTLYAISTHAPDGFSALETLLLRLADGGEDEDQHVMGRSWYGNIYAWCDDAQPDNGIFTGIAKDLVSARLRGK